jgi:hypothetical protein
MAWILRSLPNCFSTHTDVGSALQPIYLLDPLGRNHDVPARKPVACIDDQRFDEPGLVIEQKVFDVPNAAVERLDVITLHLVGAAQM